MEFNEATYDRIYKYLHNQLTEADKQDFEQAMAQNPDLVSEIEKHKNAEAMVLDAYLLEVRSQTQHIIQQKRQQANLKKWLGGGSLLLMLSAGIALYLNSSQEQYSVKAQLSTTNTVKESSIVSNTQPSPTIEPTKPAQKPHKVASTKQVSQPIDQIPSPSVDLDKEAQKLYLKQLEQQQKKESVKAAEAGQAAKIQMPANKQPDTENQKSVAVEEQGKPIYIPQQELLFDLVYEPKLGNAIEIPTGSLEEGMFKIIDEAGVAVYEANFNSQQKPVWNGQFKSGMPNHNKQLNVLLFNYKDQVYGLGKISVVY